jgi:glycerol-3-phosphate dehydrogenase
MNRDLMLAVVAMQREPFDVVVIGGGATGVGIALDAASRDLKVLLLERDDFGSGTSSRSTKIVHGGVRYLAQGRVGLVREALKERTRLLVNAPHLVSQQAFAVPIENVTEREKYFIGLKLYDTVSNVKAAKFSGAMRYFDAQFDDTRLLINLLDTAVANGAIAINYAEVIALHKDSLGRLRAVTFTDHESGEEYDVTAKTIVNATGTGSDKLLKLDQINHRQTILSSQGAHIVVDKKCLPGRHALLMPRTPDGRIMFAIPWLDHCLIGTTDTPVKVIERDPIAPGNEIEMILGVTKKYLHVAPSRGDILASFAGIRPLVLAPSTAQTSKVSREHRIDVLESGLVNVTGGKWTTYRLMAEQCVDTLASMNQWRIIASPTKTMKLRSTPVGPVSAKRFSDYRRDAVELEQMINDNPPMAEPLSTKLPYLKAHCVWAIRREMARTVEDILARRTRASFLNTAAAITAAPRVADILASELDLDGPQRERQLKRFYRLAQSVCEH